MLIKILTDSQYANINEISHPKMLKILEEKKIAGADKMPFGYWLINSNVDKKVFKKTKL